MAENFLNHRFCVMKLIIFIPRPPVWATERHDLKDVLKDAGHQKSPHYGGFTIRFTVRPAILPFLFKVERGKRKHIVDEMDSGTAQNHRPRFRTEGTWGMRFRRNSGLDTRRSPASRRAVSQVSRFC